MRRHTARLILPVALACAGIFFLSQSDVRAVDLRVGTGRALLQAQKKVVVNPIVMNGATDPVYATPQHQHGYFDSTASKTLFFYEGWANGATRVPQIATDDGTTITLTRSVADNLFNDDHGNPDGCQDSSGFNHIFYGPHNSGNNGNPQGQILHSSSVTPHGTVMVPQIPFGAPTEYPTCTPVGAKLFILTRYNNAPDLGMTYFSATPDANGIANTWTQASPVEILTAGASGRIFWAEPTVNPSVSTEIDFIWTRTDLSNTCAVNIYFGRLDTTTGNISNFANSHTALNAALPVSTADQDSFYEVVAQPTTCGSIRSWNYDAAGNPHIMFTDGPNTGLSGIGNYTLYHTANFGSGWTTAVNLGTINNYFVYGVAIVPASDGGMNAYFPQASPQGFTYGGALYTAHRTSGSGGTWGSVTLLQTAGTYELGKDTPATIKPIGVNPNFRVLWFEDTNGNANNNAPGVGTMRAWGYGDGGYINRSIVFANNNTGVQFSPGYKSSKLTLTNSNLTITNTVSNGGLNTSLASLGALSNAHTYLEFHFDNDATMNSGNACVGVASILFEMLLGVGSTGRSIDYCNDGGVYGNGMKLGTLLKPTTGNVIGEAIRGDLNLLWFRLCNPTCGGWNNDVLANQDPVLGVGGFQMFIVSGTPDFGPPYFMEALPAVEIDDVNSAFTLRPTPGSWSFAAPSGFSAPGALNFLLRRDLDPTANDNSPAWISAAA